eukprot:SAG31_NODE_448_length_15557_cov_5.101760_3_plen_170_part_00
MLSHTISFYLTLSHAISYAISYYLILSHAAAVNGDRTGQVRHDWTSGDSSYDSLVGVEWYTLEVGVGDDDEPGILTSTSTLSLTEGNDCLAMYNVTLASEPVHDVVLIVAPSASALEVSPSRLTFHPPAWNEAQSVEVVIRDNQVDQVRSYFLFFVPTIREIWDFYREM